MQQRNISNTPVGAIGYGAMVLEGYYGASDDAAAIATLQHAIDVGANMIDTADAYGNGHNELLIGKALNTRPRDKVYLATKFGIVFDNANPSTPLPTNWGFALSINGRKDYALRSLEDSLKRLGTDHIDLWYLHYPEPHLPIEETIAAMATAVHAGKVKHIGLSNVTADEIARAHRVHPISAVQYEYSLWRREVELEILPLLKKLDIALVPWSPLGSGFLTGTVTDLAKDDFRNHNPKMSGANLQNNLDRFAPLKALAAELNISPAQLALAWLLHQGDRIIPIPGTRKAARIDENIGAAQVRLTPAQLQQIDALAPVGAAAGKSLL